MADGHCRVRVILFIFIGILAVFVGSTIAAGAILRAISARRLGLTTSIGVLLDLTLRVFDAS